MSTTRTLEQALKDAEFKPQGGHEGILMYRRESDGANAVIGQGRFALCGPPELLVRLLTAEERVKELESGPTIPITTWTTTVQGSPVDLDQTYSEVTVVVHGYPCTRCGRSSNRVVGTLKGTAKGKRHIWFSDFVYRCDPACQPETAPQEGKKGEDSDG